MPTTRAKTSRERRQTRRASALDPAYAAHRRYLRVKGSQPLGEDEIARMLDEKK